MKKSLIGGATAAVIAVSGGLTFPKYLGSKAHESLELQRATIANTFFLKEVSHQYDEGWFTSIETTVLQIKPEVLNNLGDKLPENIRAVLSKPITMIHHVHHSPFANGAVPVRAVVETEFQYDPEVKKTLARFFGEQTPVTMRNVIHLDGSGELTFNVSPFDYEELSGIKLNWKGLDGNINYQHGFASYKTHFVMPSFIAQLADKGSLKFENLDITSDSSMGSNSVTVLGSSKTKLGHFEASWKEGINYDVRLNDLINTITDLQIGAFINPTGTIAPSSISVDNLTYDTTTSEPEKGFINSEGAFTFAKLNYGDKQYGPLDIDIAAEHIHADSLLALKNKWQSLAADEKQAKVAANVAAASASEPAAAIASDVATQPENIAAEDAQQAKYLTAVRTEGAGIFTNNPVFTVKKFNFQTPTGHIQTSGSLKFTGLQKEDLNAIAPMLAKMHAELNLDVSQSLIEDFSIAQMRSLFAVNDPTNEQEQQEVGETIRLLVAQTIKNMQQDGYLVQENGSVKTKLVVDKSQIMLNNHQFKTQTDEDLFAGLEEDNAASAAQ
ncbi:YdgA family protein [Kingella negevensis]|uniref:YdgA family protein n=1 Tax=Kingella negevensis TaxID=1522312 RepID=UPI002550E6D2|nr:YdgA family protein [Kingella negevensis]MDK4685030.1 YdgA family protein [Kingella negevensis]MDK4707539.1 YdgA family protein [Kingella negevensis]MDK4709985.1 YdgA family protein [Kingella negevensis]